MGYNIKMLDTNSKTKFLMIAISLLLSIGLFLYAHQTTKVIVTDVMENIKKTKNCQGDCRKDC